MCSLTMGIKKLNSVLKTFASSCMQDLSPSYFRGKMVAIDLNAWMKSRMATVLSTAVGSIGTQSTQLDTNKVEVMWITAFLEFICNKWLYQGIIPVIVYDGTPPPEKRDTLLQRREREAKGAEKMQKLKSEVEGLEEASCSVDNSLLLETYKKSIVNCNSIPLSTKEKFIKIVRNLGLPCIQALDDGEKLCSMLCISGAVAAVFSPDTDCIAHGCPILLTTFSKATVREGGRIVNKICAVFPHIALEQLSMTHEAFLDMCILLGCDHNKKLKGKGHEATYNLMRTYGTLESVLSAIDAKPEVVQLLNHVRCREMFAYCPPSETASEPINLSIDRSKIKSISELLAVMQLSEYIPKLLSLYDFVEELQEKQKIFGASLQQITPGPSPRDTECLQETLSPTGPERSSWSETQKTATDTDYLRELSQLRSSCGEQSFSRAPRNCGAVPESKALTGSERSTGSKAPRLGKTSVYYPGSSYVATNKVGKRIRVVLSSYTSTIESMPGLGASLPVVLSDPIERREDLRSLQLRSSRESFREEPINCASLEALVRLESSSEDSPRVVATTQGLFTAPRKDSMVDNVRLERDTIDTLAS